MTRDEILSMPAGREMDALVAERVMGCSVSVWPRRREFYCGCDSTRPHNCRDEQNDDMLAFYSTDIAAAWEVVWHHLRLGDSVDLFGAGAVVDNAVCTISRHSTETDDEVDASADTAPLAICRAALLAVMSE